MSVSHAPISRRQTTVKENHIGRASATLIAGSDDRHLAHTLDVSNHGVKFGGCRGEFKVGGKIEVLYRHKHAQVRVAWITAPEGSSEKQIGAEFLEPEKQIWGVEFPEQTDEYEEKE